MCVCTTYSRFEFWKSHKLETQKTKTRRYIHKLNMIDRYITCPIPTPYHTRTYGIWYTHIDTTYPRSYLYKNEAQHIYNTLFFAHKFQSCRISRKHFFNYSLACHERLAMIPQRFKRFNDKVIQTFGVFFGVCMHMRAEINHSKECPYLYLCTSHYCGFLFVFVCVFCFLFPAKQKKHFDK